MKKSIILLMCAIFTLAVVLTGCSKSQGGGQGARTFRLGHQAAAGTAYDILAYKFKEYVETRSNGRYKIEVYSGGTLGNDRVLIESIQAGTLDLSIVTASDMSNFARELEVQDLPFLFSSWDEVFNFLKSDFVNEFYAITDSSNITTMAFMPRGFRHATNNKGPINSPADFQGMKLRVVDSAIYVETFAALGANPQAMAWGEVYTALQQGTVDGHENTIVTTNDYRIYEVQKFMSKTGHIFAFAAVCASPTILNGLSAEDQELIRKAAVDAALEIGAEQLATENEAAVKLQAAGMQMNEVPNKQPFIDMVTPVYEKFFTTHDRRYYDGIRAAAR